MNGQHAAVWTHSLPLSRSSTASYMPVDAPDGTAARNQPLCVITSHSTVGLPRESRIWRPLMPVIAAGDFFLNSSACAHAEQTMLRRFAPRPNPARHPCARAWLMKQACEEPRVIAHTV